MLNNFIIMCYMKDDNSVLLGQYFLNWILCTQFVSFWALLWKFIANLLILCDIVVFSSANMVSRDCLN